MRSILSVMSSDLPGVNPTTLNGILLYYRLMTKMSGLGDSTELSRVGLSHQVLKDTRRGLDLLNLTRNHSILECQGWI
jgi:hypothetical protein